MKKHFSVVSLVIILLLAIGMVSASDYYNGTDDSSLAISNFDDNLQVIDTELDDFKEDSLAIDQNNIPVLQDALSQNEGNMTPCVNVDDVTSRDGEVVHIPFNVTDSNGNPVSGGVNVIIYGGNEKISKYIELNNGAGQTNSTIINLIENINLNNGLTVFEFCDILFSSTNFSNLNILEILSGLEDINAGWIFNASNLADIRNHIFNMTDVDKVNEGVSNLMDNIAVNVTGIIYGLNELNGAIDINTTGIDFDTSKFTNIILAVLGGFNLDKKTLKNNILSNIIIKKSSFLNGVKAILKEFGIKTSDGSITDFISSLGLKIPARMSLRLLNFMLTEESTLLEIVKLADEILDYNRLTATGFLENFFSSNNGGDVDVSRIIDVLSNPNLENSNIAKSFNQISSSVRVNNDNILNSIVNALNRCTFDKSKVATDLANITGIEKSKLLNILDGAVDIYGGFNLNNRNLVYGIADILTGLKSYTKVLNEFFAALSFNEKLFIADFDIILKNFNLTRSDIINNVSYLVTYLNLSVPEDLGGELNTSLASKELNFTHVYNVFRQILVYNNLTFSDLAGAFTSSGNGFNPSKYVHEIFNYQFEISETTNILSMLRRYVNVDYNAILNLIINGTQNPDFVNSNVANGFSRIVTGMNFDIEKVTDGIYKIVNGIGFNKSSISGLIDTVRNNVYVNDSKCSYALETIVNSITFDESGVANAVTKIVDALNLDGTDFSEKIVENFTFNNLIAGGIYKVADGLGINVSNVMNQLILKCGYVARFQDRFAPGIYDISVEYIGDDVSLINDTAKLTVLPLNTPIKFDVLVDGHQVYINCNVDSDDKGFVVFKTDSFEVYRHIVDGKVSFNDTFELGGHNVEAIYLGDLNFYPNSTFISFNVADRTKITASKVSVVYGNSKNIVATLMDVDNNPLRDVSLTIRLNGIDYNKVTDSEGRVSVGVPNLKPNTYSTVISFAGNDKYVKSTKSVQVVVSKATPKISATSKTFKKSLKTKKFTITLKNNKNKVMKKASVTIKVNGKTYTAKTNNNGKATFSLTKLTKKGTFKSVITYKGNSYYKKVTKNVNIIVK